MSFAKTAVVAMLAAAPISSALAADCAELNTDRDNLAAEDQHSALLLFSSALEAQGVVLGDSEGCENRYVLSHVALGSSITVRASLGENAQSMTVSTLEDLPRAYSQLANTLVNGVELADAMGRDNVTIEQAHNQRRMKTEYLATLGFGGSMVTPGTGVAPLFKGGMRIEINSWALDASFELAADGHEGREQAVLAGTLNLLGFANPLANHTLYYGGGLGYGMTALQDYSESYGFEARGIVGYELFRATTMRLFFQGDLVLPTDSAIEWGWGPRTAVSVGFGYKPQPNRNNGVPWWALFL